MAGKSISDLAYDLITAGHSTTGIANIVLNYAKSMTGSTLGYASVIDSDTQKNVCLTLTGMIGDSCRMAPGVGGIVFSSMSSGEYPALWGHVLNTREPFYTNSPQEHFAAEGLPADHVPIDRFLSIPVMSGETLAGQISLANSPVDYTDEDLVTVLDVAELYSHALQRFSGQAKLLPPSGASAASTQDEVAGSGSARETVLKNLHRLVSPYLEQLKLTELTENQRFLVSRLQEGLEGASSSLLSSSRLMNVSFTPQELQVALLIKAGQKTKDVAQQLDISVNAVNFHRKNIRKKLSISNKQVCLQTYLASLEEW